MEDTTIITSSPVGRHLDAIAESNPASYLVFNKKRIKLVTKITIGRETDNDIVVDNKLASRHHAIIQKIKDAVLYAKDLKDRYTVLWLNYKYFKGDCFLKKTINTLEIVA